MIGKRVTVVELQTFIRTAEGLIDSATRDLIIDTLSLAPETGVLIPGTGGCRKWRVARPDGGKSGGYRVVHYYGNPARPVYLLALFAKNQKANLTPAERNQLKALAAVLAGKQ